VHLPADEVGQSWRNAAAIGDMHHVDTGHRLKEFSIEMWRPPVAARCHADFARVGLGIGNELGNGFGSLASG
jgi:hypothetical protein